MDIKLLKALVDLAEGEVEPIEMDEFHKLYPQNPDLERRLHELSRLGYISVLDADNHISEIGVNRKAINYFKK